MAYKNQLQYITAMRFFAIQIFSEGDNFCGHSYFNYIVPAFA